MIVRNTCASWIPESAGVDTDGNTAKVQAEHAAQKRCAFGVGDKVIVQDYKDRADDYRGVVVGLHEHSEYGWSATVEKADGTGRVRKVASKLRRVK